MAKNASKARPTKKRAAKKKTVRARTRPLIVRDGARYACHADGLCCSDIHVVGPVSRTEKHRLALVSERAVQYSTLVEEDVLAMRAEDGCCVFLDENAHCMIHSALGGFLKPRTCHRFPLGITATPRGGRVFLEQRCSCQVMDSDAEPLTPERAEPALLDAAGRIKVNHRVSGRIAMTKRSRIGFERYEAFEAELLERLERGEKAAKVIDREAFPDVKGATWEQIGNGMVALDATSRFEFALQTVGYAVLARHGHRAKPTPRPWAGAYDRAEARTPIEMDPQQMVATWTAAQIWPLFWTACSTFEQHRRGLATLLVLIDDIRKRLRRRGLRADRACAEAITIVDLVANSDWWEGITHRISEQG